MFVLIVSAAIFAYAVRVERAERAAHEAKKAEIAAITGVPATKSRRLSQVSALIHVMLCDASACQRWLFMSSVYRTLFSTCLKKLSMTIARIVLVKKMKKAGRRKQRGMLRQP